MENRAPLENIIIYYLIGVLSTKYLLSLHQAHILWTMDNLFWILNQNIYYFFPNSFLLSPYVCLSDPIAQLIWHNIYYFTICTENRFSVSLCGIPIGLRYPYDEPIQNIRMKNYKEILLLLLLYRIQKHKYIIMGLENRSVASPYSFCQSIVNTIGFVVVVIWEISESKPVHMWIVHK